MKRLLILLPLLALLLPAPLQGQGGGRAGLVVQFGDGRVVTQCVSFAGESISGLELLQRSGLEIIAQVSGVGAAVCKIGDEGCNYPAEACFCKFGAGQQGEYWAYWRQRDGAWQYSLQGAHATRLRDGDVDGWAWGRGNVQSGAQPPLIPFGQICPALEAAPPAPTPQPTVPPTAPPPAATQPPPPAPTARPTEPAPTTVPPTPVESPAPPAPTATPEPTATLSQPTATPRRSTATALPPTVTQTPAPVTATHTPVIATVTHTPERATVTYTPAIPPSTATTDAQHDGTLVRDSQTGTSAVSYLIFGVMLAGVLAAIAVALRRR